VDKNEMQAGRTAPDAVESDALGEVLAHVQGKPVRRGDKLYLDIRGTSLKEWGDPLTVATSWHNQGLHVQFTNGDYRLPERLVWAPTDEPHPDAAANEARRAEQAGRDAVREAERKAALSADARYADELATSLRGLSNLNHLQQGAVSRAVRFLETLETKNVERVTVMQLCESLHLSLRPDQLYRFRVAPGCAECAKAAALYANEGVSPSAFQ
jgi:hypothetical protein